MPTKILTVIAGMRFITLHHQIKVFVGYYLLLVLLNEFDES